MSNLTYNGQSISQREDGYVNATEMAKATGKEVYDWRRNKQTQAYIQVVSSATGIPVAELVLVVNGDGGGTWIHPKLAIEFGRWVSPEFAYWCDEHIKTLMETGSTSLVPQTYAQALLEAGRIALELEKVQEELALKALECESLEADNDRQAEIIDEVYNYSSIIRVAKFNNISETNFSWRRLVSASAQMKIEVMKAPCPRFVTKNLYNHDVWRYCYPSVSLPETTTLTISNN